MADANSTLCKVPFWVVNYLGNKVQLVREFVDDPWVFEAGALGVLDGITRDDSYGGVCAVVVFDEDRTEALTHVPFDLLCPVGEGCERTLRGVCAMIPGRAGDIAHLWMNGLDLKDRLTCGTYYRYRRELMLYGINIGKPFSEALAIGKASARAKQLQEA